MRFYSKTDTGRKIVQGGSDTGIVTEYNTGTQVGFITRLDTTGENSYTFKVFDVRNGAMKIITNIEGEIIHKKRECRHDFDRYGKCINCGRWEV